MPLCQPVGLMRMNTASIQMDRAIICAESAFVLAANSYEKQMGLSNSLGFKMLTFSNFSYKLSGKPFLVSIDCSLQVSTAVLFSKGVLPNCGVL